MALHDLTSNCRHPPPPQARSNPTPALKDSGFEEIKPRHPQKAVGDPLKGRCLASSLPVLSSWADDVPVTRIRAEPHSARCSGTRLPQ